MGASVQHLYTSRENLRNGQKPGCWETSGSWKLRELTDPFCNLSLSEDWNATQGKRYVSVTHRRSSRKCDCSIHLNSIAGQCFYRLPQNDQVSEFYLNAHTMVMRIHDNLHHHLTIIKAPLHAHNFILIAPFSACQFKRCRRCRFDPWVGKMPWRRERQPTPAFLPGESPWTEEPGRATVHAVTKSRTWLSN